MNVMGLSVLVSIQLPTVLDKVALLFFLNSLKFNVQRIVFFSQKNRSIRCPITCYVNSVQGLLPFEWINGRNLSIQVR